MCIPWNLNKLDFLLKFFQEWFILKAGGFTDENWRRKILLAPEIVGLRATIKEQAEELARKESAFAQKESAFAQKESAWTLERSNFTKREADLLKRIEELEKNQSKN